MLSVAARDTMSAMVKLTKVIDASYVVAVVYGMVSFLSSASRLRHATVRCVLEETAGYKLVRAERRCHGHGVSQGEATQEIDESSLLSSITTWCHSLSAASRPLLSVDGV